MLSKIEDCNESTEIDGLIERSLDDYGFMNLVGHEIRGSIVRSLIYELQAYFDRPFEQKALELILKWGDNYLPALDPFGNPIEKWLKLEAERFRYPVFRLFHTELEAVYEEKNRSLDSDGSKLFQALFGGLFPNHQYGQQTTIGTI